MPAPQIYGSLIKWLHYNEQGDHFVAVYGSHNAQVVGIDLSINEAGLVETEQLSILGSAWAERRQELITAGGDGTLRFSALRTEYQITTHGRRLTSRMVPRMTICSGFLWTRQLCVDEAEDRCLAACDGTLLVWRRRRCRQPCGSSAPRPASVDPRGAWRSAARRLRSVEARRGLTSAEAEAWLFCGP